MRRICRTALGRGTSHSNHHVDSSSTTSSTVLLLLNADSRRGYAHLLFRMPLESQIPSHGIDDEPIDKDLFVQQFARLIQALRTSDLADELHELPSVPYFEGMFPNDCIAQFSAQLVPMPTLGREHRASETMEVTRQIRSGGSNLDSQDFLEMTEGARATGYDFLETRSGVIMAYDTPRTNQIAAKTVKESEMFSVKILKLDEGCTALTDVAACPKPNSLIVQDNVYGRAAEDIVRGQMSVLRIEDKCGCITFCDSNTDNQDVIVDIDFPDSHETLAKAGYHPIIVDWSEPKKLGYTLRSAVFPAFYDFQSFQMKGFQQRTHKAAKSRAPLGRTKRSNMHRDHTDYGFLHHTHHTFAGFKDPEAKKLLQEDYVYQEPPRYKPPMHQLGDLVPRSELPEEEEKMRQKTATAGMHMRETHKARMQKKIDEVTKPRSPSCTRMDELYSGVNPQDIERF